MRFTAILLFAILLATALAGCGQGGKTEFTTVGNKIGAANGGESPKKAARDVADEEGLGGEKASKNSPVESAPDAVAKKTEKGLKDSDGSITSPPPPVAMDATLPPSIRIEHSTDTRLVDKTGVVASTVPAPTLPPPTTAPAMADPVVGSAKTGPKVMDRQPSLPSGVLTAGSFDDNLDPAVFHGFVAKRAQIQGLGDLPRKMVGHRLLVVVRDSAGKPVGNARVNLASGEAKGVEIATRSDGKAVFMLSFDQIPGDQPLTATVTPPDGGAAITEKISAGAPRWDVTLPAVQAQLPRNLDLAIVLDTTGSMQDEIDHLKAEIRGISSAIKKKFPEVQQRFALVLYRDEGDEYVAKSFDFTTSLDKFQQNIAAQRAAGGGDYPEAMHRGLEEANQLRWQDKDTARVMFLIADAPPHSQHMNRTLAAANSLRKKGVAIYPVACSGYDDACASSSCAPALS